MQTLGHSIQFIRQNKQLMSHCNRKEMLMKIFNESPTHEWNKLNNSDLRGQL